MSSVAVQIVIGLLLGVLSYWVKTRSDTPSSVVQPRRPALRERLKKSLRRAGWILLLCTGCNTGKPVTYIPAGEPVRLAQDVKRVRVEVMLPTGVLDVRIMNLPKGWYVLPDPDEVEPRPAP